MNIEEQEAAEKLRALGFESAFAFDDGVCIDSKDAQIILSRLESQASLRIKPLDRLSKAAPGGRIESEVLDASSLNF
jgi:hypothetical protein